MTTAPRMAPPTMACVGVRPRKVVGAVATGFDGTPPLERLPPWGVEVEEEEEEDDEDEPPPVDDTDCPPPLAEPDVLDDPEEAGVPVPPEPDDGAATTAIWAVITSDRLMKPSETSCWIVTLLGDGASVVGHWPPRSSVSLTYIVTVWPT